MDIDGKVVSKIVSFNTRAVFVQEKKIIQYTGNTKCSTTPDVSVSETAKAIQVVFHFAGQFE